VYLNKAKFDLNRREGAGIVHLKGSIGLPTGLARRGGDSGALGWREQKVKTVWDRDALDGRLEGAKVTKKKAGAKGGKKDFAQEFESSGLGTQKAWGLELLYTTDNLNEDTCGRAETRVCLPKGGEGGKEFEKL